MKIYKAIQRLSWRFKQGKTFVPNANDIEALNGVVDFVEAKIDQATEGQDGFVKLYTWVYAYMIKRYNSTPFDEIPQEEVHRILDQPIDQVIEKFTEFLNNESQNAFFKEAGVDGFGDEHPLMMTPAGKEENLKKVLAQMEIEGYERYRGKAWKVETVRDNLIAQIKKAIITYN